MNPMIRNGVALETAQRGDKMQSENTVTLQDRVEAMLSDVYGDSHEAHRFYDKPSVHHWVDQHTSLWAVRQVISSLTPRERTIILMRYGFLSGGQLIVTLETIGRKFGVTRDRIRQILLKAFRKLRHPSRSKFLDPFRVVYTETDTLASLTRRELYNMLIHDFNKTLSYEITMRITRTHLTAALTATKEGFPKDLNRLLAYSCFYQNQLTPCVLCDEPSLPNFDWCLVHMNEWRKVVLICDGCGIRFTRSPAGLINYSRTHGRTQWGVFHDFACYHKHGKRLGVYSHRNKARQKLLGA